MSEPLTPIIESAVRQLFPPQDVAAAIRALEQACDLDPHGRSLSDPTDSDDLRLHLLALSQGDLRKLRDAILVANRDFRDLKPVNIAVFALEVSGNTARARRLRWWCRSCLAVIAIATAVGFALGAWNTPSIWLGLPMGAVAVVLQGLTRCTAIQPVGRLWSIPAASFLTIPIWAALSAKPEVTAAVALLAGLGLRLAAAKRQWRDAGLQRLWARSGSRNLALTLAVSTSGGILLVGLSYLAGRLFH